MRSTKTHPAMVLGTKKKLKNVHRCIISADKICEHTHFVVGCGVELRQGRNKGK